jgi:hypothetical protein
MAISGGRGGVCVVDMSTILPPRTGRNIRHITGSRAHPREWPPRRPGTTAPAANLSRLEPHQLVQPD